MWDLIFVVLVVALGLALLIVLERARRKAERGTRGGAHKKERGK